MARVFITGATGFVGSHLARLLCAEGHQVRIMRRASSQLTALDGLTVEHVVGDLFDVEVLTEQLTGIDWVFHVAAVAEYWRSDKNSIYRVNVEGTKNLLEAARQAGVARFIFTSSAMTIGRNLAKGGASGNENTVFNLSPRLTPYGHSKILAEAEVWRAVEQGLDAVVLNPCIIIGPGDLNLISGTLIIEAAKGNIPAVVESGGTNFVDVRDVAAAHLAAAERGRCGERYIIGAVNMSHAAFTRLVCEVIEKPAPKIILPGFLIPLGALVVDVGRRLGVKLPVDGNQLRLSRYKLYMDTHKMETELHQPQISIRQSIADTFAWYRANGYL